MACCFGPVLILWAWVFTCGMIYCFRIVPEVLARWSRECGYHIEKKRLAIFFAGPYTLRRSNAQVVYRVTVRDKSLSLRKGWICIGNWWWYCLSVEKCPVQECWDPVESPPESSTRAVAPAREPLWDHELDS